MRYYTLTLAFLLAILCFSLAPKIITKKVVGNIQAASGLTEVTFQPSNEDFANPERGFMKQSSIYLDQAFDSYKIRAKEPSDTVVWVYFRLDNYRYEDQVLRPLQPIGSGRGLDVVKQAFQTARQKGLKLVIRFIYNWGPGSTSDPNQANPDVPLHVAMHHIDQLMPLVADNVDVIVAMQIGFVGHWGEWHSSKYLYSTESRKGIIDALLNALPKERMLLLRYPRFKEIFYGGPLTESQAFTKTDLSRIGHHNDCFLRDSNDGGTYKSRTSQPPNQTSYYCDGKNEINCWKDFIARDGRFTPIGGETCQYNPPRTDCSNAVQEMNMLHWSFINNGYRAEVLNGWKSQGCWNEIRRRLGYRFVLDNLNVSYQVNPGGVMDFQLNLHNEGFASPFNERPLFLVLENKSTGDKETITLKSNTNPKTTDPRWWQPGQSITINEGVYTSSNLPQGNYNVYLWLPDASQNLRNTPAYSIRLANTNIWQANTGYNLLFNNLQIGGPPVTQPPVVPGDANGDDKVDMADYAIWLNNFNQSRQGSQYGDFDNSGKVDGVDYTIWLGNYGS